MHHLQTVKGNIVDAINHPERIFPIGRLDKPSEGLIFLTSDGDIVNKILRAENAHDKEYIVTVNKAPTPKFIEQTSKGVPILDTVTLPCQVQMQSRFVFKIILTQGLNRQIRRMCETLGYEVQRLVRTRIMNVSLGNLKPRQWRNLTAAELAHINKAVAGSRKTASHVDTLAPQKTKPQGDELKPSSSFPRSRVGTHTRHSQSRCIPTQERGNEPHPMHSEQPPPKPAKPPRKPRPTRAPAPKKSRG